MTKKAYEIYTIRYQTLPEIRSVCHLFSWNREFSLQAILLDFIFVREKTRSMDKFYSE